MRAPISRSVGECRRASAARTQQRQEHRCARACMKSPRLQRADECTCECARCVLVRVQRERATTSELRASALRAAGWRARWLQRDRRCGQNAANDGVVGGSHTCEWNAHVRVTSTCCASLAHGRLEARFVSTRACPLSRLWPAAWLPRQEHAHMHAARCTRRYQQRRAALRLARELRLERGREQPGPRAARRHAWPRLSTSSV